MDVIEKSTASEYSQVHLVRKPDQTWRLCIDFKNLNDATESMETRPIQNIPIVIDRVTQHLPRLYEKSRYDIWVLPDSQSWTVTTLHGFHNFHRIVSVMPPAHGVKRRSILLSTHDGKQVLAGLLYIFVELYLDDLLVYATSDEEFLERLRIVFERFRQLNITLNPKKCYFGLVEVEFVGHVLKTDGVYFVLYGEED